MIAWWSVTFSSLITRAERQHVERRDVRRRPSRTRGCLPTSAGDRLELGDHVARQEARARPRIRERLVLLVQALRRAERAPRGEAEARVRVALQRRQVVEERRLLGALGLLELGDRAALAADRLDDRRRLVGGLEPRVARRRGSGPRRPARPSAANVASTSQYGSGTKARISSSRRARIASVGVCTRPSDTAPSNDERSRIVAARVAFMPTIQSASDRERAAASSWRHLGARRAGRRTPRASPRRSSTTATGA